MTSLSMDDRILRAHEEGAGEELVTLYREAARRADAEGDDRKGAFFLTHAWIFALECGHEAAHEIAQELRARGQLS